MNKKEQEKEYHRILTKKYASKKKLTLKEKQFLTDYAKLLNNTVYKEENKRLKKINKANKVFLDKADKLLKKLEQKLKSKK